MSSRDLLPDHPADLTLLEYLVGDLPTDASDRIRRHVAACRGCRRTIAELSLTVDELDRLPTVPIPHDAMAFGEEERARPFRRVLRLLPIVAILLAVAGVVGVLGAGGGREPAPARAQSVTVRLPADGREKLVVQQEVAEVEGVEIWQDRDRRNHLMIVVPPGAVDAVVAALDPLRQRTKGRPVAVEVVPRTPAASATLVESAASSPA
jgi:anti-sigma factor RsiW